MSGNKRLFVLLIEKSTIIVIRINIGNCYVITIIPQNNNNNNNNDNNNNNNNDDNNNNNNNNKNIQPVWIYCNKLS